MLMHDARPGCPSLGERLAAREDEPSPADAQRVQDHVGACTRCRLDLQAVDHLLAEWEPEVTALQAERLARGAARLHATLDARRTSWSSRRLLRIAAVVPLLVSALAWYAWPTSIGAFTACLATGSHRRVVASTEAPRLWLAPGPGAAPFKSWQGTLASAEVLPPAVSRLLDRYSRSRELLRPEPYQTWRTAVAALDEVVVRQGDLLLARTAGDPTGILRHVELQVRADTCEVVRLTLIAPEYRVEVTR